MAEGGVGGLLKNKKIRPWLIGGMVLVGGLVLFTMLKGGGGGGGGGAVATSGGGVDPNQLAAATAIQQTQIGANVEMAKYAGELEAYRVGADTSLQLATLESATAMANAQVQQNISLAGIDAQKQMAFASEATAQRGIDAQAMVQTTGLQVQGDIAAAQYAYMGQQSAAQFAYMTAQDTNRRDVDIAEVNAQVDMNYANQKTARRKGDQNFLGGLVTSGLKLFAMFSDVRLKEDVSWTGESQSRGSAGRGFDEAGRYSWIYRGDGSNTLYNGVMAQDVRHAAPGAVLSTRQGRYLAVDYGALPF